MTASIHSITERAMTANLSIGVWQGYRLDKEATRKVTTEAGAALDAARVNKHLIPKEDLAAIVTAQNAVRTHFYTNTLPWRDNGDRLMTRKLFLTFIPEHEALVTAFKDEVEKFLTERYPIAIERACFRMGEMFDRNDYPPISELRRKFYIGLDIDAVTSVGDFRVEMDQEHADKVRAVMEAAAEKRVHNAMQDIWVRLAKTVGAFAERMGDPDAKFRESTIDNLDELIDLIPGLNVLDDPEIEDIRKMMDSKLSGLDAKEIRKDPAHRAELASDAQAIMDRMSGFMKAFGVEES